ncbi:nucleotidyltransferase substrate binding protein%2C HI0074 family [uncultured Eubacterium sp.]|nr:nucleotidyltransferase substrate binding protein%2C HI0074 family [uncultured Eubacterium sp.]
MKKYTNFCKALLNLNDMKNYNPPYSNVERTGLVGLFSICFEQSWKLMKDCLEKSGYEGSTTGSPRMIIKTAFQAGMIDDENLWLDALAQRNNVSHSYNEDIAESIIQKTKDSFLDLFEDLKEKIEKSWL